MLPFLCGSFLTGTASPLSSRVNKELDINGMLSTSTLAESYELHERSEALPTATAGPDEDDDTSGKSDFYLTHT